jgi:hypothetical protein
MEVETTHAVMDLCLRVDSPSSLLPALCLEAMILRFAHVQTGIMKQLAPASMLPPSSRKAKSINNTKSGLQLPRCRSATSGCSAHRLGCIHQQSFQTCGYSSLHPCSHSSSCLDHFYWCAASTTPISRSTLPHRLHGQTQDTNRQNCAAASEGC